MASKDRIALLSHASHPSDSTTSVNLPQSKPTSKRELARAYLKHLGLGAVWSANRQRRQRHVAEEPKVIVRRNFWVALSRCWIHSVPLCMTIVLSWLHIPGFYIGATLEGFHGPYSDSVKFLALQLAAKVLELLVIASLATIVVDVIRSFLLNSDTGIPLGMLTAHLQFSELSYFWSPEFWGARRGLRSNLRFIVIGTFLVVCGGIALLTGPAAATLLIPVYRDRWAAGGTDYWLAGNSSQLWPENLSINDVGAAGCWSPQGDAVPTQLVSNSGCVWAGYASLNQLYREAHQNHVINVTLSDGLVTRLLQRNQFPEAFTIAPHVATVNPSNNFGIFWAHALSAVTGVSSYAHYKRLSYGAYFEMKSYVPLVRTMCIAYTNAQFANLPDYWDYPYFPVRGEAEHTTYRIKRAPFFNSTVPATSWIVPSDTTPITNSTGQPIRSYPSAFINLQIPWAGSFPTNGTFFSCTVDARWVRSSNVETNFDAVFPGTYTIAGRMPFIDDNPGPLFPYTSDFLPPTGSVGMDNDWLQTLTPPIIPPASVPGTAPAYNTLSDILRSMRVDDGHTDVVAIQRQIESLVATVVADGMSRVGYSLNGGAVSLSGWQSAVVDRYNISFQPGSLWAETVYKGTATTPLVPGYDASNSTRLRWNVFITGYSFKADGSVYWLSLALFFTHAVLALSHIAWRLFTCTSSDAWEGVTDLVALAAVSEPPRDADGDPLRNTCSGVDERATMAVNVAARVVVREGGGLQGVHENVQLVFGDVAGMRFRGLNGYRRVQVNRRYGASDEIS